MMTSVVSLVMSPVTTFIATLPILVSCIPVLETTLEKGPWGNQRKLRINSSAKTHSVKPFVKKNNNDSARFNFSDC